MDAEDAELFAPGPGEWCDCCPHAIQAQETLASLIHHAQQALDQQNESTEVIQEATRLIDYWKGEAAGREREIEAMAMEIYELKAKVIAEKKKFNRLAEHLANMNKFLGALGYSGKLQTTEDAPPA